MIYTKFEEYCEGCDEMEPVVDYSYACFDVTSTRITCVNLERCKRMANKIKEALKNKENVCGHATLTRVNGGNND